MSLGVNDSYPLKEQNNSFRLDLSILNQHLENGLKTESLAQIDALIASLQAERVQINAAPDGAALTLL